MSALRKLVWQLIKCPKSNMNLSLPVRNLYYTSFLDDMSRRLRGAYMMGVSCLMFMTIVYTIDIPKSRTGSKRDSPIISARVMTIF